MLDTELQLIALSVQLPQAITVGSIYLHPTEQIQTDDFSPFLQLNSQPKILFGDFNAHNPIWGGSKFNTRGRQIEYLVSTENLSILHPQEETHFSFPHQSWSTLDLILLSSSLLSEIQVFGHPDLAGSDHRPILLRRPIVTPQSDSRQLHTPSYRKTNWDK